MAIKKISHAATGAASASIEKTEKGFHETMSTIKDGMSGAVAGFEKTQTDMKSKMEKAMKTAEEMVSFSQGNFEAVMKSSQIWATGMQDLTKSMAATAQAHMEQTMSTFKALSSIKSLKDAMDLQSSLARTSLESMVQESSKISDASMKLAEQAIAPITARVTLAVEKFGSAV